MLGSTLWLAIKEENISLFFQYAMEISATSASISLKMFLRNIVKIIFVIQATSVVILDNNNNDARYNVWRPFIKFSGSTATDHAFEGHTTKTVIDMATLSCIVP